ncbi:MAG TPA: hypothetical protein V6C89_03030 [Drouetiella sp.]|jgi:hypothetical protein
MNSNRSLSLIAALTITGLIAASPTTALSPMNVSDPTIALDPATSSRAVTSSQSTTSSSLGDRVGLVAEFRGEWILESGKQKREIQKRGISVYANERPLRVSKDGSLTVVCVNNTTAVCPGNHKIGEPFLLSEAEQVDDWWSQFMPFISNYGSWIFPASRHLETSVSLKDAVVCLRSDATDFDVSDVFIDLPEGNYKAELFEAALTDGHGKAPVNVDVVKKDSTAIAKVISAKQGGAILHHGTWCFEILSGPKNSKDDWSMLEDAYLEITGPSDYAAHRANLQTAQKKMESWNDPSRSKVHMDVIRALLSAQSNAPASAIPKLR